MNAKRVAAALRALADAIEAAPNDAGAFGTDEDARKVVHDPNAGDDILTREQVAKILGVCPLTVTHMTQKLGLPVHRIGRLMRFLRSEVVVWMKSAGRVRRT